MASRFITVPYAPDCFSRYEVLESFRNGDEREFHLRKRGGQVNPEGAEMIRAIAEEYGITGMVGTVHPLAGDLCIIFTKGAPIDPTPPPPATPQSAERVRKNTDKPRR